MAANTERVLKLIHDCPACGRPLPGYREAAPVEPVPEPGPLVKVDDHSERVALMREVEESLREAKLASERHAATQALNTIASVPEMMRAAAAKGLRSCVVAHYDNDAVEIPVGLAAIVLSVASFVFCVTSLLGLHFTWLLLLPANVFAFLRLRRALLPRYEKLVYYGLRGRGYHVRLGMWGIHVSW